MAKSTQADDADLLALADFPVMKRRIGRDPRAKQRCRRGEVQLVGDLQRESFINNDAIGITAAGNATAFLVGAIVSEGRALTTELLEARLTMRACTTRIDHAADPGKIAFLELFDLVADFSDATDDLVAGDAGILRAAAPFVADGMDIGMADAAEKNLNLHIERSRVATLERIRCEG